MKKYIKFIVLFSVFCFLFSPASLRLAGQAVLSVNYCSAQNSLFSSQELANCRATGDCKLNDFARVAINISGLILGIVGSLALLMFIYGGVMFLISAGNAEKVTQAKQIIIGAVIGLVIVFTSYMIIQFVFDALGLEQATGGRWSVFNWFQ